MKENIQKQDDQRSNRKGLYSSMGVWITIYMVLIASGVYLITADHAFAPHHHKKTATKNLSTSLVSTANDSIKMLRTK